MTLPPEGQTLDLEAAFGSNLADHWLEVGFGGGEHLAWQLNRRAETRPETPIGIIGAEYFANGIAKLLSQVEQEQARRQLRIYRGDARDLLAALPQACLGRVFVLFPDPWPKRRHHKRRFFSRETLDLLAAAMRPGAELRLATDDEDYLGWCLAQLGRHRAFVWTARRPEDWRQRPQDWPPTRYERKAVAAGRRPSFLRYRRADAGSDGRSA